MRYFLIALSMLVAASLACNMPAEAPTTAPTTAPPEATFETPGDVSTPLPPVVVTPVPDLQTFTGMAVKTDYASNGQQGCDVSVIVTLNVYPDGTAQLQTTGPDIVDHYNCASGGEETWYVTGTENAFSQTVTFTACNNGAFSATGFVTHANQMLLGTVSCFNQNGSQAIMLKFNGQ